MEKTLDFGHVFATEDVLVVELSLKYTRADDFNLYNSNGDSTFTFVIWGLLFLMFCDNLVNWSVVYILDTHLCITRFTFSCYVMKQVKPQHD